MSRLLCAGCTGLIGSHLLPELLARGHRLVLLSRDPQRAREELSTWIDPQRLDWAAWDGAALPEDLGEFAAVIDLCGAGIADARWSAKRKRILRESRLQPTAALARAVAEQGIPLLVQASGVGWYGRSEQAVSEDDPPGSGFLAELTRDWEAACAPAEAAAARVVKLRIAPVLSPRGGVLERMLPPVGPLAWLGSGRQPFAWIHAEDVVGLILAALDDRRWSGPVNAAAPEQVDQRGFVRELARAERRWVLPLGVPGWILRLAIGEMADMVLGGAPVVPAAAELCGYRWRHGDLGAALRACHRQGKGD